MKRLCAMLAAIVTTVGLAPAALAEDDNIIHGDVAYFQDFKEFEPKTRNEEEFGGIARLSTVLKELSSDGGDPVIAMGGDVSGGSVFNAIYKGAPFVEAFNELGVDVGNFGNHDFDYGADYTRELIEEAEFDWISSNLRTPEGAPFSPHGTTAVHESRDFSVGFVALSSDLDRTSAARDVIAGDFINSARNAVAELEQENIDAILLLSQLSREDTLRVMEEIPQLAAALREENGAATPAEIHETSDGRPVIAPDADYGSVIHLDITTNRDTGLTKVVPSVIRVDSGVRADPKWAERSDEYYRQLDQKLGSTIGRTSQNLDKAQLGIMVADSYRRHFGTQLGWQNGGGIRSEIPAGPITLRDAYSVLPFSNQAVAIEATGEEILLGLEQGIQSNPSGSNGFPRVAGLTFEFDANAPYGERVNSVTLDDGTPLEPTATYTVAISRFLQEGGDGTTAFLENDLLSPNLVTDLDAFVSLLKQDFSDDPVANEPGASSQLSNRGSSWPARSSQS